MAHVAPTASNAFLRDLLTATNQVRSGVVPSRARAATGHWKRWLDFCDEVQIDPYLRTEDPNFDAIPFLQVFATRYRSGVIAPRGKAVRARTVEDALRAVAQEMATVGAADPRLNSFGSMDFRLQRLWKSYKKVDPPPHRVKPVPLRVLRRLHHVAHTAGEQPLLAITDMILLAFFFLLRPGEYTGSPSNTSPFTLADVQLFAGRRRLPISTCPEADFALATFCTLTFTDQKNGVKGEVIGLGVSGDPSFCPVKSMTRRILDLRRHGANQSTILATYYVNGQGHPVTPSQITTALRSGVHLFDPAELGFLPSDISARSLRAAGAMALLCAQVDTDIIRLIGRWRSDEMLRYLHVQAEPIMRHFAAKMISLGDFALLPNSAVPMN